MPSWRLACALAAARCASGLRAPARRAAPRAPRRASASEGTILEAREVANKKAERRRIASSPTFFRTHGDFKEEQAVVQEKMLAEMKSTLLDSMRAGTFETSRGEGNAAVTFRLAQEYGMCWGAERSIELALAATEKYPDKRKHITNELLHNPGVNNMLADAGVEFVDKTADGGKRFDDVSPGDVVILPAFGATLAEMQHFDDMGVTTVDTTCPWVTKVWNVVDKQVAKGMTTVIHGKYAHEEAIATASYCDNYIMVKNIDEAEYVCRYILNPTPAGKEALLAKFAKAMSKGFDPDVHLAKVGLANQTTMYKKETRAVGQLLQKAVMERFGPQEVNDHYMEFDTICDATQERQDAVHELVENASDLGLDFILVVGGWDSSNTAHLLEIPQHAGVRSFHINRAECIGADNTITHRTMAGEIVTEPFLENLGKDVVMGVTSGASTPDASVQDSLSQIFLLKKVNDGAKA